MLSDKITQVRTIKKRKTSEVGRWYSDSQKLEAVKLWLVTGNLVVVSAALNVPLPTLKSWRYTDWWGSLVTEIKTEDSFKLSSKLKKIADRALDETMDRLEKGDWIYDQKTGEMRRKPVAMRDAHLVAIGLTDRAVSIDKKPREEENNQKTQDRLLALAEAFANLANKTRTVEIIDAFSEERQEGLREGASVGTEARSREKIEGSSREGSSPKTVDENREST